MRSIFFLGMISVFTFLLALPSMAQPEIFGIATELDVRKAEGPVLNASPFLDSRLYMIDPNTGQPTEIGAIEGFTRCTGLDIHPVTGQFFAVCEKVEEIPDDPVLLADPFEFNAYLLKLNPMTAEPTVVGTIELSRGDFISDISFRSDGTLFAHLNAAFLENIEDVVSNTVAANSVGIIDTLTANLTIIGPTGSEDSWSAIGFSNTDSLIQCTDNRIVPSVKNLINQNTGNATLLSNLIYPPDFDGWIIVASKDYDNLSGLFYATVAHLGDTIGPEATTSAVEDGNYLMVINESGQVQEIGFIADETLQFGALAVRSDQLVHEVPTLSEYGLIATALVLFGISVVMLRRRKIITEI